MPSIVPFPAGLKGYLEQPSSILAWRPVGCAGCGSSRAWHCHGTRPRYTSIDGVCVKTLVFLVRCPCCRATAILLPDGMTPWFQHGTETIRLAIDRYVTTAGSYRRVALELADREPPEGESLSVVWGSPAAPSPTPSTLFRWVVRFATCAARWWSLVADELQRRLDCALRPPPITPHVPSKARTDSKRQRLQEAWYLLWALKALLSVLGHPTNAWPRLLVVAPRRPPGIDASHWLARPSWAPP